MTTAELMSEFASRGLAYQVIGHQRTMTAGEEAGALGLSRDEVAKTIVLVTDRGNVRAVVPASQRLDVHKLGAVVGGKVLRFATEAELAESYPMFELGAVPPFGGPGDDRVVVDLRLADSESIVVEAGTHTESVRLGSADLIRLVGAEAADICAD
jgi:Ala-tRNA(Pro) deacylase